jgi:hypothetical protein
MDENKTIFGEFILFSRLRPVSPNFGPVHDYYIINHAHPWE